MLDKKRFYADWQIDRRFDERTRKYITPKCVNKHVFHRINDNYEIIISWSADYARNIFGIFSAQLVDSKKSGSEKYLCPDIIIKDLWAAGITSDYKLYRHLDKWVTENVEIYERNGRKGFLDAIGCCLRDTNDD